MVRIKDLYCGAGGSGLGATMVDDVELVMAANHDPIAIETHTANFPNCEHDCADISQVNPRRYPRTEILWASPECTNHSVAKGRARKKSERDKAAERSRATMWDVPRFAEYHQYEIVIVENVVDAASWKLFRAWLMAMKDCGYDYRIISLNSMHAPAMKAPRAPQSRDRMYGMFWRTGITPPDINVRPLAWCPKCHEDVRSRQWWKSPDVRIGRYRQQYLYRCVQCRTVVEPYVVPAAEAIDWNIRGQRIGDRREPLSPKTMDRIRIGLERYGRQPQLIPSGGTWNDEAKPTTEPFRTRTTRENEALLVPLEGRDGKFAQPAWLPMRTQTARHETGIAFIAELRGGGSTAHSVREPLATVCANGNHHMLVESQLPPVVNDCEFRMLEIKEIQAAMAFTPDYKITGSSNRVKVRQLGNAVTPPAAEFLVGAAVESLKQTA